MTLPRLTDIEQRANAATEGPWRTWQNDFGDRGAAVETAWSHDTDGADTELLTDWCSPQDAEFISSARTDVPALTAAIRAVLELTPPGVSPLSCYGGAPDDMPDETAFWDEGRWALAKEIREAIAKHLDVNP